MKKLINAVVFVPLLAFSLAACEKSGAKSLELKAERGSVSGIATDAKGFPLRGVVIELSHTVWTDKSLSAVTDSTGFYKILLPAEPRGNWNITARYRTNAYDQVYRFFLDVNDNSSFGGVRGAIRNFKWKLSGENINGQYGAAIYVHQTHYKHPLSEVKLILSPLEEFLIDGSDAKAMEKKIENTSGVYVAKDVPIGRYTVQAFRNSIPLRISTSKNSPAKEKTEIVFSGTDSGYSAHLYLVN